MSILSSTKELKPELLDAVCGDAGLVLTLRPPERL
jgi:hypothetical protein